MREGRREEGGREGGRDEGRKGGREGGREDREGNKDSKDSVHEPDLKPPWCWVGCSAVPTWQLHSRPFLHLHIGGRPGEREGDYGGSCRGDGSTSPNFWI